ncbi:MAG: DUF2062 domain-containing protein [Burkholderiales bacterium]
MLRKYLRRVLPSHESIRDNRYLARFGNRLQHHNLWHLRRRSVAGGIAAGMFAGLIPGSNPVQFAAGAFLAITFKVNLPLSTLVTLYSNPFTIVPLYWTAFKLGQLALWQDAGELPAIAMGLEGKGFTEWIPAALHWLGGVGKPLLVGLPLLALLLALVGYFATDWAWRLGVMWQWRQRSFKRKKKTQP